MPPLALTDQQMDVRNTMGRKPMLSLDDEGMTMFQDAQTWLKSEAERAKFTTLFVNFVCEAPRLIKPDPWQVRKAINRAYSELGIAVGQQHQRSNKPKIRRDRHVNNNQTSSQNRGRLRSHSGR